MAPAGKARPEGEGVEGERQAEPEIHETELEGIGERERQRGERGSGHTTVDRPRGAQHAPGEQRRDCRNDHPDGGLQADQLGQGPDQQVDAEIADQRPVERPVALEQRVMGKIDLDAVARHMGQEVDQRRQRGEP